MRKDIKPFLDSIRSRVALSTLSQYSILLVRFIDYLEQQRVTYEKLEPQHLSKFGAHLKNLRNQDQQPIGSSRLYGYLHVARLFARYLFQQQKVLQDPSLGVELPRPSMKLPFVPTHGQVLRLLDQPDLDTPIGLRDRAMLELLYGCGLRVSELHRLTLYDIDLESAILTVVRGKGERRRDIPVGRWACYYLELYLRQVRPALMKGGPYPDLWLGAHGRPMPRLVTIQQRLCKYQRMADLPISCHSLRHAFATQMLEGGANLRQVQRLLGHSHLSSTQRYTHVRPAALKEVHRRSHPRG